MTKPNEFTSSSDFATFKGDAKGNGTVNVPSSVVVAGSGIYTNSIDLTIGKQGAIVRGQISSSKEASEFYSGQMMSVERTGTVSGSPATYSVYAFFHRPSPTTLRLQVIVPNPYSPTLVGAAGVETFTFFANTFIPPYI